MTSSGNLTIVSDTGTSHPRNLSARVAKSRFAGNLYNAPAHGGGGTRCDARLDLHPLSHSGTRERTPLWYGPRLRPAFVAQVLGQVLFPESPDPRSALAAYDEGRARPLPRAVLNRSV